MSEYDYAWFRVAQLTKHRVKVQLISADLAGIDSGELPTGKPGVIAQTKETIVPWSVVPEWMKQKLAVLLMRSYEPPTENIKNIGRRISETVFWVYAQADDLEDMSWL